MPHLGIALATTLGGWLNAVLLYATLRRRDHFVPDRQLIRALPLIVVSSVVMGLALWFAYGALAPFFDVSAGLVMRIAALAALVTVGLASYAAAVLATGVVSRSDLKRALRRG